MLKRFLFYMMCAVCLFAFVFAVYRAYKPNEAVSENQIQYVIENRMNESELRQESMDHDQENPLVIIFYSSDDTNSIFFFDNVWATIFNNEAISKAQTIAYLDLSELDDTQRGEMMRTYQFTSYPCILQLYYQDRTIHVTVIAQDDGESRISSVDVVKQKLLDAGIITIKN